MQKFSFQNGVVRSIVEGRLSLAKPVKKKKALQEAGLAVQMYMDCVPFI